MYCRSGFQQGNIKSWIFLNVPIISVIKYISREQSRKLFLRCACFNTTTVLLWGILNNGNIYSQDQIYFVLMQSSFLSQQVLEPTRGETVLDIVLFSYKYFVSNIKICEPL